MEGRGLVFEDTEWRFISERVCGGFGDTECLWFLAMSSLRMRHLVVS